MDPKHGLPAKPAWSEEFSVYAAEDAYVQRRQFTKFLVLTSFGMVAGQGWIWLKGLGAAPRSEWPEVVVARASEVGIGTVRFFTYPTAIEPCILVRRTNGEFTAFSQKCTHLSCAVYYAPARDRLECPCHEGYFSAATGRVLQGPPPRPLPRVRLEQRGDDIVATGLMEGTEE
ncbi:MAG TPA: Rieske 2Fe-2S domain-containing protein [Vicinamibacterales bacterium]|nr:Rieske 2Fe-2S domain-containing protein [Vicinamibacterales bacterium]